MKNIAIAICILSLSSCSLFTSDCDEDACMDSVVVTSVDTTQVVADTTFVDSVVAE